MNETFTIFTARRLADGAQKERQRLKFDDKKLHRDLCLKDPITLLEHKILYTAEAGEYDLVFGRNLVYDILLSEEEHNYGTFEWTSERTVGRLWWKKTEEIKHTESAAPSAQSAAVQDIMKELEKYLYNRGFRFTVRKNECDEIICHHIYW